jgi:hypothetical protein
VRFPSALVFVFNAFVWFVFLWMVLFVALALFGGTECDRAECSGLGEWASENGGVVVVIVAAVSVVAGLLSTRTFLRKRS